MIGANTPACEQTLHQALMRRLLSECLDARRTLAVLSPRQLEVACLVAKGLENAEIGAALGIGRKTAEVHCSAALHRLELRSRTELGVLVAKAGLS